MGWTPPAIVKLEDVDEIVLRYEFFPGDIGFVVNEIDLSARWGWVPVLDFAVSLDSIVERLTDEEETDQVFEFTESEATLTFRRIGPIVSINASYNRQTAYVEHSELTAETSRSGAELLQALVDRYPKLVTNAFIADRVRSLGDR